MRQKNRFLLKMIFVIPLLAGCGSSAEKEKHYLEKAQASFKERNFEKARVDIKNVLQINPKNSDALFLMAEMAEIDQDWRKEFGLLSNIVAEKPDFYDAQIKLGKLFLLSGVVEKALEKSDLVLTKQPDHKDATILKAVSLFKKNDKAGAQALMNKVLVQSKGDPEATFLLAKLKGEEKQYEEALKLIDAALATHPDEINLALMKMQFLTTAGKTDVADGMVGDLLKRFPDNNALHYSMAKYYLITKQVEKAEQVLRDLIIAKPKEIEPKLALTEFYISQKQEQKAEQTLKEFIKASPKEYELSFALVKFYKNKPESAIAILNTVIADVSDKPNSLKAKNMLAKIYLTQEDKLKAQQLLEEVIKDDAHNAEALMMRSTLLVDTGKYEDAIGDLRTVLRDQPESEKAHILSARTHLKSGYFDLAEESLKNSLAINPSNLDVRKDLAKMLAMKHDENGAISLLEDLDQTKHQNAETLAMLADLYARKNDWSKAEDTAKSIAKIDNSGLAPFKLAQYYAAQKNIPKLLKRIRNH